jgi:hypothetical protein
MVGSWWNIRNLLHRVKVCFAGWIQPMLMNSVGFPKVTSGKGNYVPKLKCKVYCKLHLSLFFEKDVPKWRTWWSAAAMFVNGSRISHKYEPHWHS